MEQLIESLKAQLTGHFQGAELQISPVSGGDRLSGYMTWEEFEGVPQRERQRDLWQFLRNLPEQTQRQISSILTLTPGERDNYLENATEDDW